MEEIAQEYITLARQLATSECYTKALDFYLKALEKNIEMKHMYESEFRVVLSRMSEGPIPEKGIDDVLCYYSRALEVFPNNMYIFNDLGSFFYKIGYYENAMKYFGDAFSLDYSFVNAEKNFNSVKNLLVERWHFRMLNDKIRNEAYRKAICDTLIPHKDTVLDLGTGTGLLSLYANECAPRIITACDGSKVMAQMARKIGIENACEHFVIFNKLSTEMQSREVGGKRSLLITEMFDAGLFGEHILQSLIHAWENLMSDVGRVIPNKAEFFIIGAKCDFLNKRYQLCSAIKSFLKIPTLNVHVITCDETYDCEDVHLYSDDIKYMTEPQSLIQVDFNSCLELKNLIQKDHFEVKAVALESGEINTVIGFFNLYLTDNITITTDPRSDQRANAWQQAIFFDKIPIQANKNDIIPLNFLLNGGKLTLCREDGITRVSLETIRFLNDTEYLNAISECVGTTFIYLEQMVDMSHINIIDLCPFPIFGLDLLKRGALSLTCYARTDADKHFFKKVFKANNIALSRVTIMVGDDWTQDGFGEEKYHVIFCHVFEICGEIDSRLNEIALHLKEHHLIQGGLFFPTSVKIVGQVVQSNWLDINNRLFDKNVSNYKISKHLKQYEVSQNFCIDFSHLEYTALSDPCELDTVENLEMGIEGVPIIKGGRSTAVLCWYSIELMKDVKEISTNRKNCFMDGIVFMTDPKIRLKTGQIVQIVRYVGEDGAFMFPMYVDET